MPKRESTMVREEWLIGQLDDTPWASAAEIASFGSYTKSQVRKSLGTMVTDGLVRWKSMGATKPMQMRYILTREGVNNFRELFQREPSWYNCEAGVRDLAARLPMVEQLYSVIPKLLGSDRPLRLYGLRPGYRPTFVSFQWLRSSAWHAIADCGEGLWFVLVWVGIWSSLKALREKWDDRQRDMYEQHWETYDAGYRDRDTRPSAWVIVGQDLWAAQTGIEEVAPEASDDMKLVFVDGRDLSRTEVLIPSRDRIMEQVPLRPTGNPEHVVDRLGQSAAMYAVNGTGRHEVFNIVSEYRGCTVAQIRRYLRDAIDEDVGTVVRGLVEARLVARFDQNHYLAPAGSTRAARIDRRRPDNVKESLQNFVKEEAGTRNRYRTHDGRAMEIAIRLKRHGYPSANGWRANLHVEGMRTVTPDLVVLVGDGVFGHNWCYLEYEHSATKPAAIANKLRTYRNFADQGVELPLIVVCDDKKVVDQFLGQGLYMIGAVYSDVMNGALAGDATVFRDRRGPVSLYPPVDTEPLLLWPELRPRHGFVGRWAPDRREGDAGR